MAFCTIALHPILIEKTKIFLMYYFLYYGFSYSECVLIFFWIFISGTQKLFWIYFSEMYYFLFQIFISRIKVIFGIFKIMLGASWKILSAGRICLNYLFSILELVLFWLTSQRILLFLIYKKGPPSFCPKVMFRAYKY